MKARRRRTWRLRHDLYFITNQQHVTLITTASIFLQRPPPSHFPPSLVPPRARSSPSKCSPSAVFLFLRSSAVSLLPPYSFTYLPTSTALPAPSLSLYNHLFSFTLGLLIPRWCGQRMRGERGFQPARRTAVSPLMGVTSGSEAVKISHWIAMNGRVNWVISRDLTYCLPPT